MQPSTTIGTKDGVVQEDDFLKNARAPRPVQWRRGAGAIKALALGQGGLDSVYTVVDAVGGMCEERLFQRFSKAAEGRRLLAERPDLPGILGDHATLAAMPEGSLGRVFVDLCQRVGMNSVKKVESQRRMSRDYNELDPARQWFTDRLNVLHDLWHVLTGYATQTRGEAAMVAFSYAQGLDYRPVPIFMTMSVALRLIRIGELHAAYRRGRKTKALMLQRYEELLPLPLSVVRERLAIPDGRLWHGPRAGEGLLV
jgi:ubiquinone biosynthesis protein COQ4